MANCRKCERQVICPWASLEEIICSSFKAKPVTNADRIRAMTDEELADYMSGYCCSYRSYDTRCKRFVGCNDCWLDWLKEEAKDGE